jgi:dTDP-4-dehydrorhamnose 3,5-epimerase
MIKSTPSKLDGVLLIEPKVIGDQRGFFMESWRLDAYKQIGVSGPFVQDNVSRSARGVLRGLHYQQPHPQGKLVGVLSGEVYDVVVDLRVDSPTFRHWQGYRISADNHKQLWIPAGFAHGYQVLSDDAVFAYKCTDYYRQECEVTLRWDDPVLGIDWPLAEPIVSEKDRAGLPLQAIEHSRLFSAARACLA